MLGTVRDAFYCQTFHKSITPVNILHILLLAPTSFMLVPNLGKLLLWFNFFPLTPAAGCKQQQQQQQRGSVDLDLRRSAGNGCWLTEPCLLQINITNLYAVPFVFIRTIFSSTVVFISNIV